MGNRSKQTDFAKDFLKEADANGLKSLVGAVGMPDKGDWQNIMNIISVYRKESVKKYGFDILVDCIATARRDYRENGGKYEHIAKDFNLVNKDSNMRYHFELPESFIKTIELAYPIMFRDKKHYAWFCNNFKQLMISGRY